jgi:hypothetical protein
MKLLLKKWEHKKCNEEVKEFGQLWEGAYKTKQTDQVTNCLTAGKKFKVILWL